MRSTILRPGVGTTQLLAAAALAAAFLCHGRAFAAAPPAELAVFAQQVQKEGHEARLPPHLSIVLALGDGTAPTPVRQAATRVGTVVHTFNVLAGVHRQRVLISYDESTQLTEAFMLRANGTLGKAVTYRSGGASRLMAPAAASAGFQHEVNFWSEYLRGRTMAPPLLTAPAPRDATIHP